MDVVIIIGIIIALYWSKLIHAIIRLLFAIATYMIYYFDIISNDEKLDLLYARGEHSPDAYAIVELLFAVIILTLVVFLLLPVKLADSITRTCKAAYKRITKKGK